MDKWATSEMEGCGNKGKQKYSMNRDNTGTATFAGYIDISGDRI